MLSALEWTIAARYLRARRREGFISVIAWFSLIGIALGVATLIIVMSVMNGFRAELLGRILGLNGHLMVRAHSGPLEGYGELAERLRRVSGVVRVAPVVEGHVMATANGRAMGGVVRGMRPELLASRAIVADNLIGGRMGDFKGEHTVFVGIHMAARLGLSIGDKITLISPQSTVTAFGGVPRLKTYRLGGTFQVGMYEYDSSFIYMPLKAAQIYFRMPGQVSGIQIFVDDPDRVRHYRRTVRQAAGRYRVVDWQQLNSHFFTALQVERNVMFIILTLIILVAAFNVTSSMIMLVKDKGKAIAILRTMGATRGMIQRIFIIAGASVGVIGTGVGLALGLVFCANIDTIRQWLEVLTGTELWSPEIRFLSTIPAKVDSTEVMVVVAMALGLSFLATIYPAWRAARLDPVEALRYE